MQALSTSRASTEVAAQASAASLEAVQPLQKQVEALHSQLQEQQDALQRLQVRLVQRPGCLTELA